jgi:hypothetical protein
MVCLAGVQVIPFSLRRGDSNHEKQTKNQIAKHCVEKMQKMEYIYISLYLVCDLCSASGEVTFHRGTFAILASNRKSLESADDRRRRERGGGTTLNEDPELPIGNQNLSQSKAIG